MAERGDSHHVRSIIAGLNTPEHAEHVREEARALAAGIAAKVPCERCGAAIGDPCAERTLSVHLERHTAYVRGGW